MKNSKRPLLQQWPRWQQQWPAWIWVVPIYQIGVSVFLKYESLLSISIVEMIFKWHNNAYQGQCLLSRNLFTSNKTRWCNVLLVIMIGSENIKRKWISFPVIVSMTSHTRSMSNYDLQCNVINVWLFHALHLEPDKKTSTSYVLTPFYCPLLICYIIIKSVITTTLGLSNVFVRNDIIETYTHIKCIWNA